MGTQNLPIPLLDPGFIGFMIVCGIVWGAYTLVIAVRDRIRDRFEDQ